MLKRLLKKYPFFLLLLPVFVLLHIEKEYRGLIDYALVYGDIVFLLAVVPVIYLIAWVITRSQRKSAVLAVLLLLVYYFFGEIKDALKAKWPDSIWQSYIFLLTLVLAMLILVVLIIRRSRSRFERAFLFFNTLFLALVIVDCGTIFWNRLNNVRTAQHTFNWTNKADSSKPDIYFFIFDSYTSSRFLQEKFGFDNSRIDSALVQKGFRIIPASHSNYNLTPFSLGSTFSGNYLPDVDTSREYYLSNYLPGVQKIYENPLFPGLRQLGYETYNHSLFDIKSAPTSVPAFDIWGLNTIYTQHNLWKKMDKDIGWQFPRWLRIDRHTIHDYAANRDRHDSIALQHIFETIKTVSSKPKFVYGHLFIPHSPYTFDSAGSKIEPIGVMPLAADMKAYTDQIVYVNSIMVRLVNEILAASKRPVAIIIQGDHGYRFFDAGKKQWEFPNFNAIYFSNGDYRALHDSLTNVNTFRVVANTYFGQQYPMLDGKTFFLQYK